MGKSRSFRFAGAAGVMALALTTAAGCGGPAGRDTAPPPQVYKDWVTETRRKADKAPAATTSGPAASYDGWGTLTGTVIFTGSAPRPRVIDQARQDNYCSTLRELPTNEDLLVGPEGGLINAVAYVNTRGVPVHERYETAEEKNKEVVLDNRGCRFEPHICLLRTTQPLRVKNSDGTTHNTQYTSVVQFFNENIGSGSSVLKQLTKEERAPTVYKCDIHKWMSGYLVLRAHPYMAKTGENGAFELKDLPAGAPLEIQLWHERAPTGLSGTVDRVEPEGTPVKLDNRGRLSVTIPKDGNVSFRVTVSFGG